MSLLLPYGILVLVYNLVGSVAAWLLGWPPQLGGWPDPEQSYLSYLWNGSAISAPLPPVLALALALVLTRGRGAWRTVGHVVVGLLGILFVIGGLGEIVAVHEHVPRWAVLLFSTVAMLGGLILLTLSALEWRRRGRVPAGTG